MAGRSRIPLLVIGGGIGGLAAATAASKAGQPVHVIEKAEAFAELGAGLQLGPNTTRMLDRLGILAACFRSRCSMQLEILALRHQLAVYRRSVPRPRLQPTDRLLWSWLARVWSGWQDALAIVQPCTVVSWQQKRFREHWRRLNQGRKPGRPAVAMEVRVLIREMSQTDPTWGSPRIVGELRKLGIVWWPNPRSRSTGCPPERHRRRPGRRS
jgi:2-polyprenyl-6-methoxyphenol hydroxylase-like FAD-dependent oxidoreductase